MTTPAASSIILVPGSVIWNPTDLNAAEPYGGTYLGTVRGIKFEPGVKYRDIWAEEYGTVVDSIFVGQGPCDLSFVVRHFDTDVMSITDPLVRAGTSLWAAAGKLLFAPKAAAAHPAVILYNAIPRFEEDMELRFALSEEFGLMVRFRGTPDATGRIYKMDLKANISL